MELGKYNNLTILRFTGPGAYLGDDLDNDVLLPGKYTNDQMEIGDEIEVFIYLDSEDRPVATTEKPFIICNEFAYLKVKEVTAFGAFMDWGLEKDLLVPFKEQNQKLEEGKYYLTTLRLDDLTQRLYGSTKINKYIENCENSGLINKELPILIGDTTELGIKVIVDNKYSGIIYHNDVVKTLKRGSSETGYIYNIRPDGKVDIRLEKDGFEKIDQAATYLLDLLKVKKAIYLSDNSDPELIREEVGMSKKTFKKALGQLYKKQLINILDKSIELRS